MLRLHPGPPPANQLQQLTRALEALQPNVVGRWAVQVASHRRIQEDSVARTQPKVAKDLSLVTFGGQAAVFMVLRHEKQIITADNDMLQLLNRIALYKQRSSMLFEGTEYVLGDFTIRLCRTILKPGEEVKGAVMDVEYMAASNAGMAHAALEELIGAIQEGAAGPLPDLSLIEMNPADFGISQEDAKQHAALLYMTCASVLAQARP